VIRYEHTFRPETRAPARLPPPGSVDAQIHVFGDPQAYPLAPGRVYDPPFDATFAQAQRMHRALGIAHGVIVQPTGYGTDHRLLLDCLAENPAYRGTAIVDDTVSDAELARLHAAGVRGARFNFKRVMGAIPGAAEFERSIRRIAELGWHAKVRSSPEELPAYVPLLRTIEITVVLDHMAHIDASRGTHQPACKLVLDLLAREGWWIMLSNADKYVDPPWDAAVELAQAFIAAAPDRALWATDWPHLGFHDRVPQSDVDRLELFYRYAATEENVRRMLVENPRRLYDFADAPR
jgi:predicted TIM-barrel fold metal-dependent hydrolase